MKKQKITGIILAGGKSSRMGTEKGLLQLGTKRMIEHAIDILKKQCDQIIISANSKAYDFLGYPVVADVILNSGPMGGIYSGLISSKTELNLVLSCDMPLIQKELLADLINNNKEFDVVVPWHEEEKFEPMCALYKNSCIPVFEAFIQRKYYKIPDAFKQLKTNKLFMSPKLSYYKKNLFENLNSKEEFEKIRGEMDQFLPKKNSIVLIAGTGRNVGKTSLACELIKEVSKYSEVIGLKISPHGHTQSKDAGLVCFHEKYSVYKETDTSTTKDSSRMLNAGASQVYYIQAEDGFIGEAFYALSEKIDSNIPMVCESGGLRNYIIPSLFIICDRVQNNVIKEKLKPILPKANKIIRFNDPGFDFDISRIKFENNCWVIK
jgi:molybdopterin-guanine dinucleotide biosynthesis protein A